VDCRNYVGGALRKLRETRDEGWPHRRAAWLDFVEGEKRRARQRQDVGPIEEGLMLLFRIRARRDHCAVRETGDFLHTRDHRCQRGRRFWSRQHLERDDIEL
jgi:hypothetical protein